MGQFVPNLVSPTAVTIVSLISVKYFMSFVSLFSVIKLFHIFPIIFPSIVHAFLIRNFVKWYRTSYVTTWYLFVTVTLIHLTFSHGDLLFHHWNITLIMEFSLTRRHLRFGYCPVGRGCRIHRLHLCRRVSPPLMSFLDMTLNNMMGRFQWC